MTIYEKNLEALLERHPKVAQQIESVCIEPKEIAISYTDSGEPEVWITASNKDEVLIGSAVDLTNMPQQIENVLAKKGGRRLILVMGFGLGHYPEAILKRLKEDDLLIIYEACPELLKTVMQIRDLCDVFGSTKVRVLVGEENNDFAFVRQYHHDIVNGRFCVLKQSACVLVNREAYERFRRRFREEKRLVDAGFVTGVHRGAEWTNALMKNIPVILRSAGVNRLKDLFKGRPAIIVSAGPSLEKNFHLLRKAKGRAVILAVDVVVPTLLPAGIIPDLVIALEANPKLYLVFQDNPLLRHTPLLCSGEVSHETILSSYPGPVFMTLPPTQPFLVWLSPFWEDKGYIEQFGGSVAHVAFATAVYMGANVIALMGQDLSFAEKLHAGDVTKLFYDEEALRNKPIATDIFGETTRTMPQFLVFKTAFENRFKTFEGMVFNATEGGLCIKGAKAVRLADFIDEFCCIPETDIISILSDHAHHEMSYDLEGIIAHLIGSRAIFVDIRNNATSIVECITRIKTLRDTNRLKSREASNLIRKIEILEVKVEQPLLNIVAPYRYRMENYIKADDLEDEELDVIEEPLGYYGELIEVIGTFLERLDDLIWVLEREREVDILLRRDSVPAIERYRRAGMLYREAGVANRAVNYLEMAVTEFASFTEEADLAGYWPVIIEAYFVLAELYFEQGRFYEAKEILEVLDNYTTDTADDMVGHPAKSKTEELMTRCEEKIGVWEERRRKAEALLAHAETNYGSHFESAAFYLKIRDYEMAEQAYKKALGETETASHAVLQLGALASGTDWARFVSAYYGLAHTYRAANKKEKALKALDAACTYVLKMKAAAKLDGVNEMCKLLGDLYCDCGKTDRAISLYEDVLSQDPGNSFFEGEVKALKEMTALTI